MKQLRVQWRIGNECNFKCGYCHPSLYGGNQPFKPSYDLTQGIRNLDYSTEDFDLVAIELQGGEVTSSDHVRDIIKNTVSSKVKFSLHTNASADLDWWQASIGNFQKLVLAWHPKIDSEHFKSVVNLAKTNNIDYVAVINAENLEPAWSRAVEIHQALLDSNCVSIFKTLFANYQMGNNKFLSYNEHQWDYYTRYNQIEVPKELPVEFQIKHVEDNLYDNYFGHLCWAGCDQIVIDYRGDVFRGWCHSSLQSMGNIIQGPIYLDENPKVCPVKICKNAFDKEAKKSKNSWGLS